MDVVVIGAGVVGLTSAIRLLESGANVRVVTADEPTATTSVLASAMVGPTFMPADSVMRRWEQVTVDEVLAAGAVAGVHLRRGRLVSRVPGMIPPGAEALPGFRLCTPAELPPGFESGCWLEVPLIEMGAYIAHLARRFAASGGVMKRRELATIDDARDGAAVIVNCAGLGARTLVPDHTVVPIRGPRIVVENPGLDEFLIEGPPAGEFTSYHPHGDIVVLGGIAVESSSTTPDPAEATAIIARCVAVEPRLADARLLEHRVGLRPGRPSVRLEVETRVDVRVVHNYGHGAMGVTTSWGCAADTAALALG